MINKSFPDITLSDLEYLINNEIRECKTIEYKKEINFSAESDKIPFLAEITSFANTDGGDLIIGIEEDHGIPCSLDGVTIEDIDKELLSIENIIRNGIEPRLISYAIKPINTSNGKFFIVIRINKSFSSPHRVSIKGHDKFYGRNSAGKYPLDVSELRYAFMASEQLPERIRNFRKERNIAILDSIDLPIELIAGARMVMHVIPISSIVSNDQVDINKIYREPGIIKPIGASGWDRRYNLDGILVYSLQNDRICYSYTQLYRSGIIEAVRAFIPNNSGQKYIPSRSFEDYLIDSFNVYMNMFKIFDIQTPVYILLSFLNIKDYTFFVNDSVWHGEDLHANRNKLLIPELVIESYEFDPNIILKPIFDLVWNAFGFEKSFNYDESGRRITK